MREYLGYSGRYRNVGVTFAPPLTAPGERRGGRQHATPNRRTVLTDRILAAAAANPSAAIHELVLILARARSMHGRSSNSVVHVTRPTEPATKIRPYRVVNNKGAASKKGPAIGAKAGLALDLLFTVAQDTAASLADRRKAASKAAEFFLPKTPGERNHVAANSLLTSAVLSSIRN
jgi:hypothetical protein